MIFLFQPVTLSYSCISSAHTSSMTSYELELMFDCKIEPRLNESLKATTNVAQNGNFLEDRC